jgi:hypothetical protein
MSTCFTRAVGEIVQLPWDNYDDVREAIADEAGEFGIPEAQIPELVRWAKEQRNTNYLVYSEVEPALELRQRFITNPAAHVIGIGLHTSLLASFESQLDKDMNRGTGLLELVNEKRAPRMVVMYSGLSRLDSKRLRSIHGYATMRQTKHTRDSAFARTTSG